MRGEQYLAGTDTKEMITLQNKRQSGEETTVGRGGLGRFCRGAARLARPSGEHSIRRRKEEEEYVGQREQHMQVTISIRAHGLCGIGSPGIRQKDWNIRIMMEESMKGKTASFKRGEGERRGRSTDQKEI